MLPYPDSLLKITFQLSAIYKLQYLTVEES
jgi:hypothetical protein